MATLTTATAIEDDVLEAMKSIQDAVLRTVHYVVEGVEPITKLMPELPFDDQRPAPADVVKHTFVFVDKLVANQREFALKFVELLPVKVVEPPARAVKAAPKAQAA